MMGISGEKPPSQLWQQGGIEDDILPFPLVPLTWRRAVTGGKVSGRFSEGKNSEGDSDNRTVAKALVHDSIDYVILRG